MMKLTKSSRAFRRATALVLAAALTLSAPVATNASAATKKVPSLSVKKKTLYYNKAGKKSFTLKVKKNKVKKIVSTKWTTSKKSVAKISKAKKTSVKVTAVKAGSAKIKATVKYKAGSTTKTKKLTCKVTSKKYKANVTAAPSSTAVVTEAPAPATDTPAPATDTPAPATDTPAPATDTPAPSETPATEELKVTAVNVLTSSKVNVTFSKAVDETTVASNFTLTDGATVTGVEFNEDRTVATLIINGLTANKEYTLTVAGVTAGDAKLDSYEAKFTAKEDQYSLLLENDIKDGTNVLKADGKSYTKVKVSLVNGNGEVVKEADKVELKFDTTAGNFANQRVTVQNGVAENIFTSESLIAPKTALITVTIISAKDTNLINVTNTMNIVLDPSPTTEVDSTVGATLTDIKVQTADKVALFFNKKVNVKDYTSNNKANNYKVYDYDATKMEIIVTDGATKTTVPVVGLSAVEGNEKALYAHLAASTYGGHWTELKQLTDNAEVKVKVTDKTKTVPVTETKTAILQDITNPSVLSVTNEGLTKIVLTFSEAVNPIDLRYNGGHAAAGSSANNIKNYVIDGVPLSSAAYGVTEKATAEPGNYNVYDGSDTKNVVTITLGKNAEGKQIYLPAGKHSIQISNVGDAANVTDVNNNKLITQSLDFTVAADDTLVTADVEVQSPEQYVVTLSRKIENAVATLQANLELQKWDSTTSKYVKVADPAISVRKDNNDTTDKKYIVEVTKDWTKVYDTQTSHKNYYNDQYRLYIAKDTIENPANGKKNAEISMLLNNEIITNPDVTSPEIKDVVFDAEKKNYTISLSEPVQVPGQTINLTQNQTQDSTGIPNPTVSFIKSDNSVTIPAKITGVGPYDNTIIVKPSADLTAGTWKVVVYSISDDIGNTAATLVKPDFTVDATVAEGEFSPLWVVAVPATAHGNDPIAVGKNSGGYDVVYVKYSKNISTAGSSANVVSTANYQVNGYPIPVATKIDVSIDGYNKDVLDIYGINGTKDIVAIQLKAGTLATQSNNVYIAPTLESAKGEKITNAGLKTLDKTNGYFTWNYKTVVDGTSDDEDFSTVDKIKAALANGTNVDITTKKLTDSEAALTIDKAITVDFSGSEFKSLTIDTQATGTVVVENLTVDDITVNAPYADVKFVNVKSNAKVDLKNVLKTFSLDATTSFAELNITPDVKHDISVKGKTGATITTVNDRASANVTYDPLVIITMNQLSAHKFVLDAITLTTLNIRAAASLCFDNHPSTITTMNIQKDVKLKSIVKNVEPEITNKYKDVTYDKEGNAEKDTGTGADLSEIAGTVDVPFGSATLPSGANQFYPALSTVNYVVGDKCPDGFKVKVKATEGSKINLTFSSDDKESNYGLGTAREKTCNLSLTDFGKKPPVSKVATGSSITISAVAAENNQVKSFEFVSITPYIGVEGEEGYVELPAVDLTDASKYVFAGTNAYTPVFKKTINKDATGTLDNYKKVVVEYENRTEKKLNFSIVAGNNDTDAFVVYGAKSGTFEISLDSKCFVKPGEYQKEYKTIDDALNLKASDVRLMVKTGEDETVGSLVIKSVTFVKK